MTITNTLPTPPDIPGWNFCYTVEVRFRDIDMFDHVNNAAYLTYAESARVAYYYHITGIPDPRDFDMTLAHAEVDYLVPIFYGQTLFVYTRTTRIGTKSLAMAHEVRDSKGGELLATISTVVVHYDHQTGKSKALPAEIIALLESYEGRRLRD
jgi:acyl-CoA thioester hydrolase